MKPTRDIIDIAGLHRNFTEEELRKIEANWKSDFDARLGHVEAGIRRIEDRFTQAEGVLVFVKWMGAIAVAGAAFWAWVMSHFTPK